MSKKIIWVIYFLLTMNFFYVLSGVLNTPMQSVDVIGIWLFKAKAFFVEGGLPIKTLHNPNFILFHPQYPLLLPGIYSLVYFVLGRVWELPILLLYPFYYLTILWLALKLFQNFGLTKLQSLIYVYIYSMLSPLLGQAGRMHAGSADTVIVLLGWIIVYQWQKTISNKNSTLINQSAWIITLLVMVASQIKLEGLLMGAMLLILPLPKWRKVFYGWLMLLPSLCWSLIVKNLAIPSDFVLAVPTGGELIYRCWLVISLTIQEMLNYKNWYIFWPLFWLVIFTLRWFKKNQAVLDLAGVILMMAGAFSTVYVLSGSNIQAAANASTVTYISSSIDRVLFQLTPFVYPLFVMASQQLLAKLQPKNNSASLSQFARHKQRLPAPSK